MCDHSQNSIEICSTQQVKIDEKLLYTETDFSKCMHWQILTDFCSHVSSHVDNAASSITLLHWLAEDSVSVLSSRSNLELLIKHSVTENYCQQTWKNSERL